MKAFGARELVRESTWALLSSSRARAERSSTGLTSERKRRAKVLLTRPSSVRSKREITFTKPSSHARRLVIGCSQPTWIVAAGTASTGRARVGPDVGRPAAQLLEAGVLALRTG